MKLDFYVPTPESPEWGSKRAFTETIRLISSRGYDGIELAPYSLRRMHTDRIRKLAVTHGLEIVCVASAFIILQHGLTISHPNRSIRRRAVGKLKESITCACELEANYVSIGLVRGKQLRGASFERGWKNIVDCVRQCGEYAKNYNVSLLIEPENTYETGFVHTVAEGLRILDEISLDNVGLMIDSYHMNIEESDINRAVRASSSRLLHVHVADSNRLAPGMGHIDFKSFIKSLRHIGYDSFLGVEVKPFPDMPSVIGKSITFLKEVV